MGDCSSFPPQNPKEEKEDEEAFVLIYAVAVRANVSGRVIRQFEKMGLTLKRFRLTNVDSDFGRAFMDIEFWRQFVSDMSENNMTPIPFTTHVPPHRYESYDRDRIIDPMDRFITEYNDPYNDFDDFVDLTVDDDASVDKDDVFREHLETYRPPLVHLIGGPVIAMTFKGKDAISSIRRYVTLDVWKSISDVLFDIKGNMMYSSATPLRTEHDIQFWFGEESFEWLHDYREGDVLWSYPFLDDKEERSWVVHSIWDVDPQYPSLMRKDELRLICIKCSEIRDRHVGDIMTLLERRFLLLLGMRLVDQEDFVKNEKFLSSTGLKKDDFPVVVMVWACCNDGMLKNLKGDSTINIDWDNICIHDSIEDIYKWFPCGMVHWAFSYRYIRLSLFEGP